MDEGGVATRIIQKLLSQMSPQISARSLHPALTRKTLEGEAMLNYHHPMAATVHSYEELEGEVLHLPLQDRSRLASRLLESLDDGDDVSDEWLEEVQGRAKSIDDGTAKLIPHDEVISSVRARLSQVR